MPGEIDLKALWKDVDMAVRRLPGTTRTLWEAVEAAVPLTIEGETLILGFDPKDMRHASYVETRVNKSQVQQVLQAKTGKRLDIRCIEGATLDAWERTKDREAQRERATQEALEQQRAHTASTRGWSQLNADLQALFASTEARRYATSQAQLFVKALPMVYETETRVRQQDPDAEHDAILGLNRAFDRIATVCDLPATQVALEYMRYKAARKGK